MRMLTGEESWSIIHTNPNNSRTRELIGTRWRVCDSNAANRCNMFSPHLYHSTDMWMKDNKGFLHLSILSFMLLSYIFSTGNLCWFLQLINITIYCTGLMHEVCTCVCVCVRVHVCAFSIKGCLRLKLGWVPTSVSVHRQYACVCLCSVVVCVKLCECIRVYFVFFNI